MDLANQLETEAAEIAMTLGTHVQNLRSTTLPHAAPHSLFVDQQSQYQANDSEDSAKLRTSRQSVLAKLATLQKLLVEPTEFLQELAIQNQLLACLQWLGEFQVLACIPPKGSVAIKNVAQLTAVPELLLTRVIRLMATAGFLQEIRPCEVAHTPLSLPFASKTSCYDAVTFLAQHVAPAALNMSSKSSQLRSSDRNCLEPPVEWLGNWDRNFGQLCQQDPKFGRQWLAFEEHLQYQPPNDDIAAVLKRLDWRNLSSACVVEVCGASVSISPALADAYPQLHFIVQAEPADSATLNGSGHNASSKSDRYHVEGLSNLQCDRVVRQSRSPGTPQSIRDAAVYILHLPLCSSILWQNKFHSLSAWVLSELKAHFDVLKSSPPTTVLIMAIPPILPTPGTVDQRMETVVRLHDMALYQLADGGGLEIDDLIRLVNSINDNTGQFVVLTQLRTRDNVVAALCIKYQQNTFRQNQGTLPKRS